MKLFNDINSLYLDRGILANEDDRAINNPMIKRLTDMFYLWTRTNGYYPVDLQYYNYLSNKKQLWLMTEIAKYVEVYETPESYIGDMFGENVKAMYEAAYMSGYDKTSNERLRRVEASVKSNASYTYAGIPDYSSITTNTILNDLIYFQNQQKDTVVIRVNPFFESKYVSVDATTWILVFHPLQMKAVLTNKTLYERAKDGSKDAQRYGTSFMLSKETERKDIGAFEYQFQIYMLAANENAKSLSEKTGIDVKFFNDIMYNRTTQSDADDMKAFIKDLPFKTANELANALGISMSQLYELGELEAKQIK